MRRLSTIRELGALESPVHLAIGVFDGVHLGHEEVLRSAQDHADQQGGTAVAATFDPHPAEILAPGQSPRRLTGTHLQQCLFQRAGMKATLAIPFDRAMANQEASEFVEELSRSCELGSIHVGVDWVFGRGRKGNLELLRELSAQGGFDVKGIAPVMRDGERISSTAIREAVIEGDLALAKGLLGRSFGFSGVVAKGDQLGRTLGFPTANLEIEEEVIPPHGVYVVRVPSHQGQAGVANLGIRPSVRGAEAEVMRFEVHLFDWNTDVYGEWMEVELCHYLRPEQRFDGLDALKSQIACDVKEARAWLEGERTSQTVDVVAD